MGVLLFAACAVPAPPPPAAVADVEETGERTVELVLDRVRWDGDAWVSEPVGSDVLVAPVARRKEGDGTLARAWSTLPVGEGVARVRRSCGEVEVLFRVGTDQTIVLPYPACDDPDAPAIPTLGARMDLREVSWERVARTHALGLFLDVPDPPPGEEGGPARYLTLADARAWCAWNGGRLPFATEWSAAQGGPSSGAGRARRTESPLGPEERVVAGAPAPTGPNGHEDLVGNVEEWLDDGTVAGGSFLSIDREPIRKVPPNARAETIGLRCVYPVAESYPP